MRKVEFNLGMDRSFRQAWKMRESMDDVAKRMGVSRSVLYRRARELDLPYRKRRVNFGMMRYKKKVVIPDNCHPLVRKLFKIMQREGVSFAWMSDRVGICRETIWAWGENSSPLLINIEAGFNAVGYKLVAVKDEDDV